MSRAALQSLSMLTWEQARQSIADQFARFSAQRDTETLHLSDALGRVLAQELVSDRDYPPFDRAIRDGYAVRAADALPGSQLPCVGEIKAGDPASAGLAPNTCIQIMTGASVPPGADAVVMLEYTSRSGDTIFFERFTGAGQHIVRRGSESAADRKLLAPGARLGFAELALAAQIGASEIHAYRKPSVAILPTGDELVPVDAAPAPHQIRNSNAVSLAAQVHLAGGEAALLGVALDDKDDLRAKIERGLQHDLLLLSGGVSMGKYDLVEAALRDLGAEFFFDAVSVRPGKPTVFGRCQETFFLGLPGNPISTMVTFELFASLAIAILGGVANPALPLASATLADAVHEKPGMTHFLPARLDSSSGKPLVRSLPWQGSGDVVSVAKSNCFLVVPSDREKIPAGELVTILLRKDVL